jgi:imidazolonepropionase-like amidohydrolase
MQDKPIAFVDVNLIPMDKEQVLRNRTVIVRHDKVAEIAETDKLVVPKDAVRIDGRGKFLMPGLADMHTHTWAEADFLLFIANGVTTIRNMWGTHRQLAWRKRIANGSMLGPTIFTAGPLLDGSPPVWNSSRVIVTPEEAEKEVAEEKKRGYDFVKVYNRLSLEAYQAVLDSARKLRMPVAGHVPDAVGLERALEAGQDSIEHLTGYIEAIQTDNSPVRDKFDLPSRRKLIDFVDEKKIPQIIAATRKANTWNCVTLVVHQKSVSAADAKKLLEDPRMRFVPPSRLARWDPSKDFRLKDMTALDFERMQRRYIMRVRLTGELHRAGARVLLGTDNPNPFVIPGFSVHEELQNLVKAGLSPYEAIKAGTKESAEFLDASAEFGTVEVGKRADLILLEANPLENVGSVSSPLGVMVRGRWFPKVELLRMLDELVGTYVINEERLDGLYQPFSSEGQEQFHSSYRIKFTDTLLGEERLVLQKLRAGGFIISSQLLMNAPPRINSYVMRLELNGDWTPILLSLESETSVGSGKVSMERREGRVTIRGNEAEDAEFQIEKNEPGDILLLLGSLHLASYLPAVMQLRSLSVGQVSDFRMLQVDTDPELEFAEVRLQFERKPNIEKQDRDGRSKSLRVFGMVDTRSNASYTGTLLLDDLDRLAFFERVEQTGLTRFELFQNTETPAKSSSM